MADRPDDLDMRSMMPPKDELRTQIDAWLTEDIGRLDITTEFLIPADAKAEFVINTRDEIVLCGMEIAAEVFRHHVPDCRFDIVLQDGTRAAPGSTLGRVQGPARGLLTAERTALNLLQLLTGIATLTSKYAALVEGSGATLIDTRKTIPGYRALSKYAAVVGGARNHRIRLDDGVLIKDNHIAAAGSLTATVERAQRATPALTVIEVECDTLEQVAEAAASKVDMILLDNMEASMMKQAVEIVAGRCRIECSGGVRLDTVREKAETGVDFISSGRMTQSSAAVDIGLDFLD